MNETWRWNGKPGEKKQVTETLDGLTGVLGKNAAEEQIISRMGRRRSGALFLCDVNDLKRINLQYGHLIGDECLKQVAQVLSYMIRPDGILCRSGGDEFAVFLPDCQDVREAQEFCIRIEKRFRTNGRKDRSRVPLSVTVVWVLRQPGDSCGKLFARAYEELKNQTAVSDSPGEHPERDHYIKDVRQVRKELVEQIRKPGAYCQDYETFKSIYRFLERGIIRSGQKACVILITVVDEQGGSLLPHEKDVLMEQLGKDIENVLRIGDVYTRYSSSQYLALVIDTTEGQAESIVDRIKDQFLAGRQGNNDILIHHCYELQPARVGERMR